MRLKKYGEDVRFKRPGTKTDGSWWSSGPYSMTNTVTSKVVSSIVEHRVNVYRCEVNYEQLFENELKQARNNLMRFPSKPSFNLQSMPNIPSRLDVILKTCAQTSLYTDCHQLSRSSVRRSATVKPLVPPPIITKS